MHRHARFRILALFLTLILLSQTGCIFTGYVPETSATKSGEASSAAETSAPAETSSAPEPEKSSAAETASQAVTTAAETEEPTSQSAEQPPKIPEYYHFEKEPFLEDVKKMSSTTSSEEALALYDSLYQQVVELMSLRTAAEIIYDRDTTNTAASDEASYTYNALMDCGNSYLVACKELTEGPHKDAFLAKIGQDAFDSFAEYRAMTEEELKLREREDQLEDEYDAVWNRLDDFIFKYDGEDWTFDRLSTADGSNLYYNKGAKAYYDVVYGLEGAIFEAVGPIYVELVQIRDRIAKLNEYDNYVEYAYEETYGRDFSEEEAQAFCDAVKKITADCYYEVTYGSVARITVNASFKTSELMEKLGFASQQLDPELYEHWKYLSENKLYDIGPEEERIDASFTTSFPSTETPFIFCKTSGRFRDFTTLTHEFGHFINFHKKKEENVLLAPDRFDLSEIHSNGLELLMTNTYPAIFGNQAENAARTEVADALQGVLDGCLYDEFQRKVYTNPTMTAEQIRDLFYDLCVEYGKDENDWGLNYDWIFVPHNFSSPLYYLSYAVSGTSALEIWRTGKNDLNAGLALWKEVLSYSDNDKGYLEVAKACGLHPITDADGVNAILQDALNFIR